MIDQVTTLATLKKHIDELDSAFTAFNAGVSQTPIGPSFNSERWADINEVLRQWQEALDTCIHTGLSETVNGFFYDKRFAQSVTKEVNVYLRSVFNVLKMHQELVVRPSAAGFQLPATNFETLFTYLNKFGDARSRRHIGKLADYLPPALLQLYKEDMAERRRRTNWGLLWISIISVATSFVLSKILGEQTKPALAVMCAISIGGIAAAVLGLSAGKRPLFDRALVKAGIGSVVAIFFIQNPLIVEARFDVQFVLRRPDLSPILQQLQPGLKLGTGVTVTLHPHDGIYYQYHDIPARYKNKEADLTLFDSKWMFHNGKKDTTLTLAAADSQTINITLIRDPATLTAHGKLSVSEPVRINVEGYPSLAKNTDSAGNFSLRMPDSFEGDYVKVSYQNKQGAREERTVSIDKIYKPFFPQEAHRHE